MNKTEHWDNLFSKGQNGEYSRIEMPAPDDPILSRAIAHFGNLKKKTIIDLGCGRGATSLFFSYCGANVISVDRSKIAIANLSKFCQDFDIGNINPVRMSAQDLTQLGKVDFIFGSMILHHLEPFDEFAAIMRKVIKPGGKGFFWENNARSSLLLWFRRNIVGKLWVPKYGDPDEFPLKQSEIDEIRKYFNVSIEYPELHFFVLFSAYLIRENFRSWFKMLDDYFYKYSAIRKYSYRQCIYIE